MAELGLSRELGQVVGISFPDSITLGCVICLPSLVPTFPI